MVQKICTKLRVDASMLFMLKDFEKDFENHLSYMKISFCVDVPNVFFIFFALIKLASLRILCKVDSVSVTLLIRSCKPWRYYISMCKLRHFDCSLYRRLFEKLP